MNFKQFFLFISIFFGSSYGFIEPYTSFPFDTNISVNREINARPLSYSALSMPNIANSDDKSKNA
ncbi:MAG: hypothetical protein IJT36_08635 [Alphaproteobacteria bacterium]|nr:hypothetical protein [Alphaproteobacteria bacterium]